MSTCFISPSSSPTKEISSLFFLFTECTTIIFPRTEGEKLKKRVIIFVHYISFSSASRSIFFFLHFFFFFLKSLLNMQPEIYLFSFQFCCSLHLNSWRTLVGEWYYSTVLSLGSLSEYSWAPCGRTMRRM